MSDDIVTRLREIAADNVYRADISVSTLYEVADEIERLRKIIAHAYHSSFVYECNYSFNTDKEPCQDCVDIESGRYD